jgi:Succinylglutamate desuccinylase / Aspartoacylase family
MNTNMKKNNNILIIGGTHGNEALGIEICRRIQELDIEGVDCLIGNPLAVEQNLRFIEKDLNRSFPGNQSGCYEEKRAWEIIRIAKDYDFVIDFHNTSVKDNNCCFVGESYNQNLLMIADFVGLKRVVVADYECVNKYLDNCISIEVSADDSLDNADYWINRLLKIAKMDFEEKTNYNLSGIELYKFVYRVSMEEGQQKGFENWYPFTEINQSDQKALNLESYDKLYPIFIKDNYTPYNFAAILTKLSSGCR